MALPLRLPLLVLSFVVCAFGAEPDTVSSPLRVAQCRATCLEKFSNDGPNGESMCLQGPDCFMCWENCELLQSNFQLWGEMCEEKEICFPGCQEACRFHTETSTSGQQSQPVIHTKGETVIQVSGALARWPRPATPDPGTPLVYVVMRRSQAGPWRQIIQTIDLTTRVPSTADKVSDSTLRVLVVDSQGLVTIYSPDDTTATKKRKKTINTEIKSVAGSGRRAATQKWVLQEKSLIHQKILVIGELSWEPKTSQGLYLVTWEVDGGGLKGNLFTDSTCVTLSLWPDTLYHIQVELVSRTPGADNLKSEMLDLDTSRAQIVSTESQELLMTVLPSDEVFTVPEYDETSAPSASIGEVSAIRNEQRFNHVQKMELLAAASSTILFAIFMLIAVIWRYRQVKIFSADNIVLGSSNSQQNLIDSHSYTKGFQPLVTVVSSIDERRPPVTSSAVCSPASQHSSRNQIQV